MKHLFHSIMTLLLATMLITFLALLLNQPASATPASTTRYVAPGGNCGSATPCYATIQAAVDAATPGDTIKVAQGTYTDIHARAGVTQVVYIDKSVTIQGGYAASNWSAADPVAHPTILDARGKGRVLYITGSISPTIGGVRITGGDATGLGGASWGDGGGGVYVVTATATLHNIRVFSNIAQYGGGIYLSNSDAKMHHSLIEHNGDRNGVGGGLYFYYCNDAEVSDSFIIANSAWDGGGFFFIGSNATLERNWIARNIANYEAGGVKLGTSTVLLRENVISGNEAAYGGGLSLFSYGSQPVFERNRIIGNKATNRGGGIYFNYMTPAILKNTVISDNEAPTGSGLFIRDSSPQLIYTTIARNRGGAGVVVTSESDYFDSDVTMTNTVIFSHTTGITVSVENTATLASTLWFGNGADRDGAGLIAHTADHTGDPKFAFDGYHLLPGSAAIDKGVDAGVATDIAGDARPYGSAYDIGADEFSECFAIINDDTSHIFGSIQAALNASSAITDVIKVAGHCRGIQTQWGTNATVFVDKSRTIQGGWRPDFTQQDDITTVDAGFRGHVFYIVNGVSPTIENFDIVHGDGGAGIPAGGSRAG